MISCLLVVCVLQKKQGEPLGKMESVYSSSEVLDFIIVEVKKNK